MLPRAVINQHLALKAHWMIVALHSIIRVLLDQNQCAFVPEGQARGHSNSTIGIAGLLKLKLCFMPFLWKQFNLTQFWFAASASTMEPTVWNANQPNLLDQLNTISLHSPILSADTYSTLLTAAKLPTSINYMNSTFAHKIFPLSSHNSHCKSFSKPNNWHNISNPRVLFERH